MCLNPYSTGSWVAGKALKLKDGMEFRLNPYSTGSWVAGQAFLCLMRLMSLSLNPYSTGSWVAGYIEKGKRKPVACLNEYCIKNGSSSILVKDYYSHKIVEV